jgi:hypothetical protein
MDQKRMVDTLLSVRAMLPDLENCCAQLDDTISLEQIVGVVLSGISVETVNEPPAQSGSRDGYRAELIVFSSTRSMVAKSVKPTNIAREVSRTIYVPALVGAASLTVGGPAGAIAALIGITYALYNAASATVGYSDACVLHKAWKLAEAGDRDFVTEDELLAIKSEIANEYSAPKCNSDVEILDAIENLKGLKAMVEHERQLILKEKIVCFENGEIKN